MATEITREQRQAVEASHGSPIDIVDPKTDTHYVLMRAETYDRLKHLFDSDPLSDEERRQLLLEAGKRAGWDDPSMDVYNDLDPRQS
jgi:hypothetical protein